MTATQAPATSAASWPPGLPRSLEYPDVPVGSILRAAARRWGERPAFIDHDVPLTFTELAARAHAVAGWLADHGVGRGTSSPSTSELPAVPAALLRGPAGRGHLLPHEPAAAGRRSRRPAHRRRRDRARHLGPGPALRPRRTRRHPGADGDRHRRGAHARLRRAPGARGRRRRRRRPARRRPHRPAPGRGRRHVHRPRAPGLHRRDDRRQQGRGAPAPQRRHQRAAVGVLDVGVGPGARRGR